MTIVLVSHGMADVEQFCQRAAVFDHGRIHFQGSASEAVKRYYLLEQESHLPAVASSGSPAEGSNGKTPALDGPTPVWATAEALLDISHVSQISNGWARCTGVAICDDAGRPCRAFEQGQTASFFYEFELLRDIEVPIGGVEILNDKNLIVHGKNTLEYGSEVPSRASAGARLRFRQDISLDLAIGEYVLTIGLAMLTNPDYERRGAFTHAELHTKLIRLCHLTRVGVFAVVYRRRGQPVQLLHHGIANLRGSCAVTVLDCVAAGRLNEVPA